MCSDAEMEGASSHHQDYKFRMMAKKNAFQVSREGRDEPKPVLRIVWSPF